jgi:flagellar hook-length control protein FliK
MPKIPATLFAPADAAARATGASGSTPASRGSRSGKSAAGGAFDQLLSGARRNKPAVERPEPPEASRGAEQTSRSSKSVKPKQRAGKRDTSRADEAPPAEARPADDAAPEQKPLDAAPQDDAAQATQPGDARRTEKTSHEASTDDDTEAVAGERENPDLSAAAAQQSLAIEATAGEAEAPVVTAPDLDAAGGDATRAAAASQHAEPATTVAATEVTAVDPALLAALAGGEGAASPEDSLNLATAEGDATATSHAGASAGGGIPTGLATARSSTASLEYDARPRPDATAYPGAQAQSANAALNAATSAESFEPDPDAAAGGTVPASVGALHQDASGAAVPSAEGVAPQQPQAAGTSAPAATSQPPVATPEARFAEDNHPGIVAGVRGQLLPSGGTMHIRLDPPELGPLSVTVRLRNGVMEASFETSSDDAARLLSHSLSALKTSLESQGVNVERLHVQQVPKSESSSNQNAGDGRDGQQGQERNLDQEHAARQEHQRRQMLRRMWQRLTGTEDPLDMVA